MTLSSCNSSRHMIFSKVVTCKTTVSPNRIHGAFSIWHVTRYSDDHVKLDCLFHSGRHGIQFQNDISSMMPQFYFSTRFMRRIRHCLQDLRCPNPCLSKRSLCQHFLAHDSYQLVPLTASLWKISDEHWRNIRVTYFIKWSMKVCNDTSSVKMV